MIRPVTKHKIGGTRARSTRGVSVVQRMGGFGRPRAQHGDSGFSFMNDRTQGRENVCCRSVTKKYTRVLSIWKEWIWYSCIPSISAHMLGSECYQGSDPVTIRSTPLTKTLSIALRVAFVSRVKRGFMKSLEIVRLSGGVEVPSSILPYAVLLYLAYFRSPTAVLGRARLVLAFRGES